MIVFHEGLPGSGKSYESCAMHILPAIQAGRRVVTNIEGINFDKFSELSGVPVPYLKQNLICVYDPDIEKQKALFLEKSGKDALIVIDEIQNLFPQERAKLSPEWSRYVTEHRHDGLDIVLMGQDRRDCHAMWRRRIQRVITFNKLSAVGQDNRYRWECLEATRPEKFKKTSDGVRTYDAKYFGLYKSHTDGTENKDVYADKRANVLNLKSLRWAAVGSVIAAIWAASVLFDFFTPGDAEAANPDKAQQMAELKRQLALAKAKPAAMPQNDVQPTDSFTVQGIPPQPEIPPPIDVFDEHARNHRIRLAGLVYSESDPDKFAAQIDILSATYHRKETFSISGLRDLGWKVTHRPSGLYLQKGDVVYIARPWPIDKAGTVDKHTAMQL